MEYKLSKSSEKDINRLIEYKNRTIYQYAKDLSNEEIDRINKYVTSEVPRLINDYCNITVDNKIVGCILLTNNDNGKLLDEIYLEEEYRNKGYAKSLLKFLCGNFKQKHNKILVGVTEKDISFLLNKDLINTRKQLRISL